jgi:hypothetical protein
VSRDGDPEVLLKVARLIYAEGWSLKQFYDAIGVDRDDVFLSNEFSELVGILTAWDNPPS